MAYFDPQGRQCGYSEAYLNGRLRTGFCDRLADGERVGFDLAFMDGSPSRIYLTDDAGPCADVGLETRNAVSALTGRSRAQTPVRIQAVLDQVAHEHAQRQQVNDAVVADAVAKYGRPSPPQHDQTRLTADRAVRDAVRTAHYS